MKPSEQDVAFAKVYNDRDTYPTIADVAIALGKATSTVRHAAARIRQLRAHDSKSAPKLISRVESLMPFQHRVGRVPMSEDESKFQPSWGPAECIDELRRIALAHPEQVISRNFFRNNAACSESTWNCHFGTFEEFKRQAGLKLTRQQHAHERSIAKHASVDHYRMIGAEREDYAAKYERDNKRRFKTLVVCSDLHDIEIDPFYLRVLIDTIKRVGPDNVVFGGDVMDLPEFGKYPVDPREWDVTGRIKFAHDKIFKPAREAAPDAQMDLIEGNHENRAIRHIADATPALRAILADLHGMTIGKLFGLDRFEMNYIAKADLAAWTKREQENELGNNYKIYYDTFLVHHFPHARRMGLPGVNGHHHSHHCWSEFNPIYGAYEWHQLGAGHKRSASYTEGERWHCGFAIVNVDTQTRAVNFDYVPVTDFAVSGGKWYHRTAAEAVDTPRVLMPS
jgi:hypothetical protein